MTSFTSAQIPYSQTGAFSSIVTDYVAGKEQLTPFYLHSPDIEGVKNAVTARRNFATNRTVLVQYLKEQYAGIPASDKVMANIESLLQENSFTITTAHQPNIFTGHLYFVYKILHAVRLAEELKTEIPGCNFIPVYYMGSEDADLEELGEVSIAGKKYTWQTKQQGAVGRMTIDKAFLTLIDAIESQVLVEAFGREIMHAVRTAYSFGKTIERATLEFVHELFKDFGLVILLPDSRVLKNEFAAIIKKELIEEFSHLAVSTTVAAFPEEYKVQAAGRDINLFYLKDDSRERITKDNGSYKILQQRFTEEEMLRELKEFPERFSPNVILRPVFQELILPNIAFIGGGGELAYWLELTGVFKAAGVPFPVLVLRNSFMFVNKKQAQRVATLQLDVKDFFKPAHHIVSDLVKRSSALKLSLQEERQQVAITYQKIKDAAADVDVTLQKHAEALFTKADNKLAGLEKKMLTAEKKKFEAQQRQVEKIKSALFPTGNLQERVDNIIPYYSVFGPRFIQMIYRYSAGLQQEFCMITEVP